MGGITLTQRKARRLYATGMKVEEISKEMGVSKATVYRWKADESLGFEKAKELALFTPEDMELLFEEANKEVLFSFLDNPSNLKDPKAADAILKNTKTIESMNKMSIRKNEKKELDKKVGVIIIDDIE